MEEKKRRSIIKASTWRFTATIITMTIAYCITGEIESSLEIGFLDALVKMIFYYFHERIWNRINWGKSFMTK